MVCSEFVCLFGCVKSQLWHAASLIAGHGLSSCGPGLVAPQCVGSQFLDHRSNLHPLHCRVDSKPRDHQGSELMFVYGVRFKLKFFFSLSLSSCTHGYPALFVGKVILSPLNCLSNCQKLVVHRCVVCVWTPFCRTGLSVGQSSAVSTSDALQHVLKKTTSALHL